MKTIKKIIASLSISCIFLGLLTTACTEKVPYDPADQLTNAQVYFSNTLPAKIELSRDLNVKSFDIELRRIIKTEALTVNLTVENGKPDIFTVPASVNFPAGSDVTKITIKYESAKMVYDDFTSFTLKVTDASLTSPYGNFVYKFTAGISAPWKTLGKATFLVNDWVYVEDYNVELQQHEVDPTRYRLVEPFANREIYYSNVPLNNNVAQYLEFRILPAGGTHTTFNREDGTVTVTTTINGLVFFEPAAIGVTYMNNTTNPEMAIWHPVSRTFPNADSRNEQWWIHNIVTQWSADGKPEVVQLSPYFVALPGGGAYTNGQDDGLIFIIFPGVELVEYDYSINLSYLGHYIDRDDVDNAIVKFTKGQDAASYKYTVVNGGLTAGSAEEIANKIIEGTIATEEDTESAYKIFPFANAGKYSVVAVTFDENGEAKDFGYVSFEFTPAGMKSPWVSLGFCEYTDDVLVTAYTDDPRYIPTYEVEIFEHQDKPGLFRLKNAYGADYPYNEPGDYEEGNVYIEIDATDPEGVFIDYQSMGVDWGDGNMFIYSFAAYYLDSGYTLDDAKEDEVCGTFKDGIITFPENALLVSFEGDKNLYYANPFGMFKVDMTSLRAASSKSSASLKSSLKRSFDAKKTSLNKNSILPVKVKSKNLPASLAKKNATVGQINPR